MKLKDVSKPYGPLSIGSLVVCVDKDLCIGAATCVSVAPHTFALDKDSKAVILKESEKEKESTIIEAARACPVAAIIIERDGKKIFPQ